MTRLGTRLKALDLIAPIALFAMITFGGAVEAFASDLDVFLVRHAEKQTGADPALTDDGLVRADALADLLAEAGIEHIHSSDYLRTRQTAAPLAERLGLNVRLYDPRDLPALAAQLRADGGRHLVVGHSNTTPQMTEALGGDGGSPIVEATEYDRLYLVSSRHDAVSTVLLRYGEPTPQIPSSDKD